jgi:hypothetical protein
MVIYLLASLLSASQCAFITLHPDLEHLSPRVANLSNHPFSSFGWVTCPNNGCPEWEGFVCVYNGVSANWKLCADSSWCVLCGCGEVADATSHSPSQHSGFETNWHTHQLPLPLLQTTVHIHPTYPPPTLTGVIWRCQR